MSGSGPLDRRGSVPAAQAEVTVPANAGDVEWIPVAGGVLDGITVPDLWWAATPLTWTRRANSPVALPVTGVSWREAARIASGIGGRLPTTAEWGWMAGAGRRRYPWGEAEPSPTLANLRFTGPGRPTAVDRYPAGVTVDGVLDVAGNVWEWTATTVPGAGVVIRGGSYNSIALYATCAFSSEVPYWLRSPGIGLRPVRDR